MRLLRCRASICHASHARPFCSRRILSPAPVMIVSISRGVSRQNWLGSRSADTQDRSSACGSRPPPPRARLLSLCLRLRECRCERRADGLTSRRHADLADDVASLLFAGAGMPLLQPGPDDGPQRAHAQASLHLGADFRDAAAKGIFQIADGVNREDQRMVAQSDFATMRVRHQPPLPPSAQVSAPDFLTVKLRLILSSTGAFHETLVTMASTVSIAPSGNVTLCSEGVPAVCSATKS